jgi:hypothetical protein
MTKGYWCYFSILKGLIDYGTRPVDPMAKMCQEISVPDFGAVAQYHAYPDMPVTFEPYAQWKPTFRKIRIKLYIDRYAILLVIYYLMTLPRLFPNYGS